MRSSRRGVLRTPGFWTLVASLALLSTACTSSTTQVASGSGEEDSSGGTEGGDEGESPSDLPMAEDPGGPARNLLLREITINQGVSVSLWNLEGWSDPEERNTPLIAGRPGLVRAHWDVGPNWEPREIKAILELRDEGGVVQSAERSMVIEESSIARYINHTLNFYLPGELIQPGLELRIRMEEAGIPPTGSVVVEPPPNTPWGEPQPDATPRRIELVVVPFDHQLEGEECPGPPDFDEEMQALYRERLFAYNPVQEVTMELHEPVVWTEDMTAWGPLLDELAAMRAAEDAPPEVYYFGLLDPCDGGAEAGWAGLARVPGEPTKENAHRRVSVGEIRTNISGTVDTFVHEIGHNQGRKHVKCDGEANPDPNYPFRDGVTRNIGFDVERWALHNQNSVDYMTYCGPTWVSDYGWEFAREVIETLSSWTENPGPTPDLPLALLRTHYPNNPEHDRAWLARADASLPSTDQVEAQLDFGPGASVSRTASLEPMHPEGELMVLPLEQADLETLPLTLRVEARGWEPTPIRGGLPLAAARD